MSNKTLAIVSYITIIGWVVAYFSFKDRTEKDSLTKYHLKQAFGLAVVSILLSIALNIILSIVPSLYFLSFVNLGILVLWVIGIINASNEAEKPLPLIGKMFEDKFSFIA